MTAKTMEELVSLCKRRGFYFNQMTSMAVSKVYMIMDQWESSSKIILNKLGGNQWYMNEMIPKVWMPQF